MKFVTDYLERAAEKNPEQVAVVDEQGQMTYGQLLAEAEAVGSALSAAEVPMAPVMVWMDRVGGSIAASQGAVLSGRAYTTVDTAMPGRRLRYIMEALQPSAIIAGRDFAERAAEQSAKAGLKLQPRILIYEDITAGAPAPEALAALEQAKAKRDPLDDLALIFTSGSTGVPKGVVASHLTLTAFTDWQVEVLHLDENTVRGCQSPLYLAVGAYVDLYSTFAVGGTLHLLPPAAFMFPQTLMEVLSERGINTIFWVASLYRRVVEMEGLSVKNLPPLRTACFCGEPMPMSSLEEWRKAFPEVTFSNHYGCTEVIVATWFEIVPGRELAYDSMPIGRECTGKNTVSLLTEEGDEAAVGELGEVVVYGPIAKGYLNDEERTKAAFGVDEATGRTFFRTGDLARRDEDGVIFYVSRGDAQIKHMGYRIELGEIETAANAVEGVSASVCLYHKEKDALTLFYVSADELTEKELVSELTETLPRYMWPARFCRLAAMPQLEGGKIDRLALQAQL